MNFRLTLNDKKLTLDEAIALRSKDAYQNLSSQEKATLDFLAKWHEGAEYFSIPTSGSTGAPKLLKVSRQQMIASARATGRALKLRSGDRALVCLPVIYVGGLMMLVRALVLDLQVTVLEPGAQAILERCTTSYDFTALVPKQLETLIGDPRGLSMLDAMKAILIGGAPINARLEKKTADIKAAIYQTFGMTETLSHVALRRLNGPAASPSYKALPGVELSTDERGCLVICAEVTNWKTLVTNDRVELEPGGQFRWLGRLDNVINSGGVKVAAEKVESAVQHAFMQVDSHVPDFFVGPLPDESLGEQVVVVFEGKPFTQDLEAKLCACLSRQLTKYEIPKEFLYVENLVRTANDKIDRRANLDNLSNLKYKISNLK